MNIFVEPERSLNHARRAREQMASAVLPHDLRDAWEDFLHHFSKAVGKTISISKQDVRSRARGHRLKNASVKDDGGLVFLREARNVDVHGLQPSAKYEQGITTLFGAFGLGPNCKEIHFENNVVNGFNTGRFTVSTDDQGRICELISDSPIFGDYRPAHIRLVPVKSEEKDRVFLVPKSLGGAELDFGSPGDLADRAVQFLEEELKQMSALIV